MLTCQECVKYLVAFLDDALEVKEGLDIEEHLRACPPCMSQAEAERTLRQFIRQQATTPPLPEELKRRIVRQAMQPQPTRSWWWRLRDAVHLRDFTIGMAAAAVVLLVLFGPLSSPSGREDMMQKFVQEASMTYGTYTTQRMPPEVASPDDKIVTQWLNTRMGYHIKVPCITDEATKLLGGRLCRLLDRKSAALIYQRNGVDLLLFAFQGGPLSLPEKYKVRTKDHVFYIHSVAGRPVAMWQHGDTTYSMVGDLPPADLLHVATTISYR
jgi:anti-sigma factor (TIGR02949 family)